MFRPIVGYITLTSLALIGCGGDSGGSSVSGSGGSLGSGGSSATSNGGNSVANGGATNGSGGQSQNRGGAIGVGGATGLGGTDVGLGGAVVNAGGNVAVGGNTTGGKATGGATNVGGNATGGRGAGGSPNPGGNTTGGKAAGGATSVGGAATGGAATGGKSTGGAVSAGGAAAGGNATAGAATSAGGAATGGSGGGGTTAIKIWIAGDSTVQTCSSACPCGWGSPAAFGTYLNSNVTINNQAISGRSVQTWMYEPNVTSTLGSDGECVVTETNSTRWSTVLNGIKSGDYFFIQFGINDGDSACPRHVGSTRYKTLLTRLAQAALDKGAHPVLLTATGMIKCSGSTAVASRGFLTETKAVGTALGVPVIDLHALSTALYNALSFCPLPAGNTDISATTGGDVGAFFCEDHTHFEAAGALQIAGLVAKSLKDQGIPLAAYLK